MSLEDTIAANTAALAANTAALLGKGSAAAPAGDKRGPGRPKKVSLNEVKAIAEKVRDQKGRQVAVALIKEHGADSLAEIDESKYAAFIAACEVALNDEGGETGDADL